MDIVKRIAWILVIIGALNWGLIGFFQFDVIAFLFSGQDSIISRIIFALVGISGIITTVCMIEDYREKNI